MRTYTLPFDATLVEEIAQDHATPFYLYDEAGIRRRVQQLFQAFDWNAGFGEFFAVKACPNPHIVAILRDEGCGADFASVAELALSEKIGIAGESLMFTSNNTTADEFRKACELGAILNLDHPNHIDQLFHDVGMPDLISFRFNPGPERSGNAIIGDPQQAKFGCTRKQLLEGYQRCKKAGVSRFGLHTMVVSNELRVQSFIETARMLFELAVQVHHELGIKLEFVNLGGGIGVPYSPQDSEPDLAEIGRGVQEVYQEVIAAAAGFLKVFMENGPRITGPFGYLVTRVINLKETYKKYVGVDACMSNLMRPGMYGAYHHITVLGKEDSPSMGPVDVVGSLCENNDKFAIDRLLPDVALDDIVVIHDAGAHSHSMGFQYNGRLRSAEFLLGCEGEVRQIRRAETLDDYFATVEFPPRPGSAAITQNMHPDKTPSLS